MAETIVIVDGKLYREGPCIVPGCKYLFRRPKGAYLRLCALHLHRYKARQSAERMRKHNARKRAARDAVRARAVLSELGRG